MNKDKNKLFLAKQNVLNALTRLEVVNLDASANERSILLPLIHDTLSIYRRLDELLGAIDHD